MNDLKFALRQLLKNPGFTAVVVISLTLGIAANTTIFSFINELLLRPPPVENPDELWQVWRSRPKSSKPFGVWSPAEISFLRENTGSLAALGAFDAEPTLLSWTHDGVGESVQSLNVSGNFFDLCGVRPALGRFFLPEEGRMPGSHPVVVVSHKFWRYRLAADPGAVGRAMVVNGVALTIIGVAGEEFTGTTAGIAPDLWVPFMMVPEVSHQPKWLTRTDTHSVVGLGRLQPGVTVAQAGEELTALTHRFQEEVRGQKPEDGAVLIPSQMVPLPVRGYVRAFTALLMGAVLLVLLIACANAANLQLARATARRQEMAVRSALGAGRIRLLRQLLTESMLLSLLAGGAGLLLAIWLVRIIVRLVPANLPLRFDLTLDWRVLIFTAVVSVATGIVFGLAPALRGTGPGVIAALKDEVRGTSVRRSRLASGLIVGQMALCLVLLLAAALCLRSLFNARALDPGFEVNQRLVASLNLENFGYSPTQSKEFYARLLNRVQDLPGVRSATWAGYLPLGTERSNGAFKLDSRKPGEDRSGFFERFNVGPGYFSTLGIPLLQGREFNDSDRDGAPRVAIINQAAADRYWPGESPIGRRLFADGAGPENALNIIGVVPTGRYRTLGEEPRPAFFECFLQRIPSHATLVTCAEGAAQPTLAAIRRNVQQLDSRLALTTATTMEQQLTLALFPVRTSGTLLGVLGIVALVLAVSGLFGVIAYSVSQRTREVGIRIALGAQRRDVLRLVMRQGMRLAGIGIVIGIAGALAATRLLRGLLFGVTATDPLTFVVVPTLLLVVALLACWLPAKRAASIDPMEALRAE